MPLNSLFEFIFCNILNSLLSMCHGIMLPLLPVSILYRIIILLVPACISNSAINNDQFLFRCTESILTVSILSLLYSLDISTSMSFTALSLLLWHTLLKCLVLPQPAHVFLYAGHCLSGCTPPQYWHGCCCDVQPTRALTLSSFGLKDIFTLSNCLDSVSVSHTAACTLYTPTLFAQASTPLLVKWSSLLVTVSSFMISSNICLSLRPWMNCSLSCLSISR